MRFLLIAACILASRFDVDFPESEPFPLFVNDQPVGPIPQDLDDSFSLFMQYSAAVNCPFFYSRKSWTCGARCEGRTLGSQIIAITDNHTWTGVAGAAMINHERKAIIVAFRGTVNLRSAAIDTNLWTKPYFNIVPPFLEFKSDEIKVHAGFLAAYEEAQPFILPKVIAALKANPTYNVFFTGHSLGAGLTLLAAVDFWHSTQSNQISVYSYAQSRTGTLEWAEYIHTLPFATRIFRIAKMGDPITILPPLGVFGYYHVGRMYQIIEHRDTRACRMSLVGESEECGASLISHVNMANHLRYYGGFLYSWYC